MTIPGWTTAALIEEAVIATRRAFAPLPDTRVIERPGWLQIITPSLKDGGMNEVLLAVLDEADVERVIDETAAQYAGIRYRWSLGPDCRPLDLDARLARRGFRREDIRVMVAPTALSVEPPPPGVRVVKVGAAELSAYSAVVAAGWGMAVEPVHAFHQAILRDHAHRFSFHLAYDGDVPAGAAGACFLARSVFLQGAVVLPRHRGRGLYRALVAARLTEARARGSSLATSHARSHTSAPIAARMGFEVLLDHPMMMSV